MPSEIKWVDIRLRRKFYSLEDKELFDSINRALDDLEENAFCGIQIQKKLIPKKFTVNNLWKCNLVSGYRLVYSVIRD